MKDLFLLRFPVTLALFWLIISAAASSAWAAPKKVALLVGVGNYPHIHKLEGPAHDVAALREVLVERWGYAPQDVQVLVDAGATRKAITEQLGQLLARTQTGDEVLVYFSGHGTSPFQATLAGKLVPENSGGFMVYDTRSDGSNLMIGRTDLFPVLQKLGQGGRHVWLVADACFSENLARSWGRRLPSRMVPLEQRGQEQQALADARDIYKNQARTEQPWPYQNVVVLAAAAAGEPAADIGAADAKSHFPTTDGKPHGALTDALLRVLKGELPVDANHDGTASFHEVYEAVTGFMASRSYGHMPRRSPALRDDLQNLGQRTLLSGAGVVRAGAAAPTKALRVVAEPEALAASPQLGPLLRNVPGLEVTQRPDGTTRAAIVKTGSRLELLAPNDAALVQAKLDQPQRVVDGLHQMAWAYKVEGQALHGRNGVLAVDFLPSELGVSREVGDKLDFVVKPTKEAYLLVVNVNAMGEVSVVYPLDQRETQAIAAGELTKLRGFVVEDPPGTDIQLWFAFERKPAGLESVAGRLNMTPGDARIAEVERLIATEAGRYTFSKTEFRTYPAGHFKKK